MLLACRHSLRLLRDCTIKSESIAAISCNKENKIRSYNRTYTVGCCCCRPLYDGWTNCDFDRVGGCRQDGAGNCSFTVGRRGGYFHGAHTLIIKNRKKEKGYYVVILLCRDDFVAETSACTLYTPTHVQSLDVYSSAHWQNPSDGSDRYAFAKSLNLELREGEKERSPLSRTLGTTGINQAPAVAVLLCIQVTR